MSTSPENPPRLLLVAALGQVPHVLAKALEGDFHVSTATSGRHALAKLSQTPTEIIVATDVLPDMSAKEFCAELQGRPAGQPELCVMIMGDVSSASAIRMLQTGADACLPLTISPQELVARLTVLVRCCQRQRELNPLTGLPANAYLEREITRRLPDRRQLAVLGFDLEDFKAYNDVYGYYRGDQVIRLLAKILGEVVQGHGKADDCLAHIGGDDFFVVTSPQRMQRIAQIAITKFDQAIPEFYDEEDRQRGGIVSFTRQGQEVLFPLMRLIAAAATNEAADIQHVGQIATILSQLKECAKQTGNRELVVDRRKIHHARRAWQQRPDQGG